MNDSPLLGLSLLILGLCYLIVLSVDFFCLSWNIIFLICVFHLLTAE